MSEQMERPPKAQRRLENRIKHWEGQVEQRRRAVHAAYDHKVEGAKTEQQLTHWTAARDAALAQVDLIEATHLEPMRADYRAILGLD